MWRVRDKGMTEVRSQLFVVKVILDHRVTSQMHLQLQVKAVQLLESHES